MVKKGKSKHSKKSNKVKSKNLWYFLRMFLNYVSVGIYYVLKSIWLFLFYTFKGIGRYFKKWFFKKPSKSEIKKRLFRKKSKSEVNEVEPIKVVESLKGSYGSFWKKLNKSDSLIGIIIGARGSGKTAVAMSILENLDNRDRNYFAMGFPSKELPNWISVVDSVDKLENDSFVLIDEGGVLFSSRNSMSDANKLLSDLLFVARHKNLTIFFISQNSSNLEINTLRQADFLILKKSSLLQKNFERKIISDIYNEHQAGFEKFKDKKGLALVYSDDFLGFIENDLPSFWSKKVSKSFK
ncbi:hypothetical protein K9L67_01335 [Candidatus Woesearchaeota archaeon]|nr:hypothetical protein [Candidatus Woesearchaeota archaeon]MCF7900847.1 hypothetical protein [Candidatus Woesearchaeota archaeon]MCF8013831.1 hypothetical protein [Candidatus Woesearchaeota archaeon]